MQEQSQILPNFSFNEHSGMSHHDIDKKIMAQYKKVGGYTFKA